METDVVTIPVEDVPFDPGPEPPTDEEIASAATTLNAGLRCSCGHAELTWELLGTHHSESGHMGVWDETLVKTTVDGQEATVVLGIAPAPPGPKPEWHDPDMDLEWVYALQEKIDDEKILIGGVAAGKRCLGKRVIDGVEIDCPHRTIMRTIRTNVCNLEHKHTETLDQVCLIHAVIAWGGEVAPAGNGPLFEVSA